MFRLIALATAWWIPCFSGAGFVDAAEIDGFTRAYRQIDLASPEMGIVLDVLVTEGDEVKAGEAVVELDRALHEVNLKIARQTMESRGNLTVAQAEVSLKTRRLKRFEMLSKEAHSYHDEFEGVRAEAEVARGRLLAAQEALLIRGAEAERARIQLERRTVRTPITGVIAEIHKWMGEQVSPSDPRIVTIVQLDPLVAEFPTPIEMIDRVKLEQRVTLRFQLQAKAVAGVVDAISPIVKEGAGLVVVKVRLSNPKGIYRIGQKCILVLPDK